MSPTRPRPACLDFFGQNIEAFRLIFEQCLLLMPPPLQAPLHKGGEQAEDLVRVLAAHQPLARRCIKTAARLRRDIGIGREMFARMAQALLRPSRSPAELRNVRAPRRGARAAKRARDVHSPCLDNRQYRRPATAGPMRRGRSSPPARRNCRSISSRVARESAIAIGDHRDFHRLADRADRRPIGLALDRIADGCGRGRRSCARPRLRRGAPVPAH